MNYTHPAEWKPEFSSTRRRKWRAASAPLQGQALLEKLQQDVPRLSPKMAGVAQYCIDFHESVHMQRISHVAERSRTQPSTVVRFAKRYGYHGFNDFKFAFLALSQTGEPTRVSDVARVRLDPLSAGATGPGKAHQAAQAFMAAASESLKRWSEALPLGELEILVSLVSESERIWVVAPGRAAALATPLIEGWRQQGKQVSWVVSELGQVPTEFWPSAHGCDAVIWLELDPSCAGKLGASGFHAAHLRQACIGVRPWSWAETNVILPTSEGDPRWWMGLWAQAILAATSAR